MVKAEKGPPVPKKLAATTSRPSPTTREMPVAMEKMAVLRATRLAPGGGGTGGSSPRGSPVADKAAIVRRSAALSAGCSCAPQLYHGQHPFTEEADPSLRAGASGEPSLHLHHQDLLPSPGGTGRRVRCLGWRRDSQRAREHHRQGRQAWSHAPQHRCPQEVPSSPHPPR